MFKHAYTGKEGFTGPQGPSGLPGERGKPNLHLYYIFYAGIGYILFLFYFITFSELLNYCKLCTNSIPHAIFLHIEIAKTESITAKIKRMDAIKISSHF